MKDLHEGKDKATKAVFVPFVEILSSPSPQRS
jgi:hypothetical protein